MKLIGQGNTSEIYEYGSDKVLKLYRNGMPQQICEKEFYITEAVYEILRICPYAFEQISVNGRIGGIYEKIIGKSLLSSMLENIKDFKQISAQMAHYHIAIQKKVNIEIPSVHEKLKEDIQSVDELSQAEKNRLYEYIDLLPKGLYLCHFDFHPGNIIIRNRKAVVIDWMTACIGDKLADVARTGVLLKYSESPTTPFLIRKIIKKFQKTVYEEYIQEYLKITKENIDEINKWEYPIMAARLREYIPKNEKRLLLKAVRQHNLLSGI